MGYHHLLSIYNYLNRSIFHLFWATPFHDISIWILNCIPSLQMETQATVLCTGMSQLLIFSLVSSAYKASFHVCHQNICRKLKPKSKSPGIHSAARDRQYAGGGQHLPLFRTQLLYAMQYNPCTDLVCSLSL